MSINQKLEEIYNKIDFEKLKEKSKTTVTITMTSPFLIKVDEEKINKADIKIMIVGQETWDWCGLDVSVKEAMEKYEKFFIKENFWNGYGKSAFFKGFNYFKRELSKHYKDKNLAFVWNNISKIGRNDSITGVTKKLRDIENHHLQIDGKSLIEHEIELIKPDIIIFLTGDRDFDIKSKLKNVSFTPIKITNTKKSKINYDILHSVNLGNKIKAVRLYHPSYFGGFHFVKNDALQYLIKN